MRQANRRALATDEWLRVEGCDSIYALGDCATINQRKVMVKFLYSSLIHFFHDLCGFFHFIIRVLLVNLPWNLNAKVDMSRFVLIEKALF